MKISQLDLTTQYHSIKQEYIVDKINEFYQLGRR